MKDVFDIDLYDDSNSDEIEHQLHRLRNHPLWMEAISDPMHPSNKVARLTLGGLVRSKDEAMEAQRFRPPPPPADVTPAAAKAMHDRLIADPAFRRAYRDSEDPRQDQLTNIMQQLQHWAHPPNVASGAGRSAEPDSGRPSVGEHPFAPAAPRPARDAIAGRLADAAFAAAYMDRDHPGHADAMTEMTGLHQAAAADAVDASE